MRKTFQKWLCVFVLLSFAATSGVSYILQTNLADERGVEVVRTNLQYVKKQITLGKEKLASLKRDLQSELLEKARAFALLLKEKPNLLERDDFLQTWAKSSGLEEISVLNDKATVAYAFPKNLLGTDFNQYAATKKYLFLMNEKDKEYVEDIRVSVNKKGKLGKWVQFAGVPRLDQKGIIQMGYSAERYAKAMRTASIKNLAPDFTIGKTGYVLVARKGKIVSATTPEMLDKSLAALNLPEADGKEQSGRAVLNGEKVMTVYEPFEDYTLIGVYPEKELYANRNSVLFWSFLFYVVLYAVVFALISYLLERIVISGIKHTNSALQKITQGDLNETVNVRTNAEFISLSDGINATVTTLKHAIAEAAARIDKELEFAREIQKSSLPRAFPPYPDINDFDIAALMKPAKEVGGDFYDFFLLGQENTHLGVVIADVSGKGIPAAMFMMSAKALIKNFAEAGLPPAEIFTHTNRELCENNDAGMFVTAFMGILEIATGKFTYVNAGHNPPLIKRENGPYCRMDLKPGFMLGGLDDFRYEQAETVLKGGDTLFLYTDGVTEAKDVNDKLFGDDRLHEVLNEHASLRPDKLLETVKKKVLAYEEGTEQADDITMLGLRYNVKTQEFPAKIDCQDKAMDFVNSELKAANCPQKVMAQIDISFEEIFVNIANYAYAPANDGTMTLSCAVGGAPEFVTLTFKDSGKPFNPLKKPDPDITLGLEDREIGNLGIFMVKKIMDSVTYEYKNGQNILTLKKKTAESNG